MTDQFSKSNQPTLPGFVSATSLPGSAGGATPSVLQDGPTTGLSGPDRLPVSLSPSPGKVFPKTIPATLHHILFGWSGPAAPLCCSASKSPARTCSERLQESLEKALQARLDGRGSMIYKTAWKPHATPLGRQIFRLRASGHRTSASGHFSGPSIFDLPQVGWATTRANDGNGAKIPPGRQGGLALKFAGWHTPLARDGDKQDATPTAIEKRMRDGREIGTAMEARMCSPDGWTTPHQPVRLTTRGEMLTGSFAGMESGGQLCPRHSGWLMGYPETWFLAGMRAHATFLLRKIRKGA